MNPPPPTDGDGNGADQMQKVIGSQPSASPPTAAATSTESTAAGASSVATMPTRPVPIAAPSNQMPLKPGASARPSPLAAAAAASTGTTTSPSGDKKKKQKTQKSTAAGSKSSSDNVTNESTSIEPAAPPTASVDYILASLNLPAATGIIATTTTTSTSSTDNTHRQESWRASDAIRRILTSPYAPMHSRRPTSRWSNKFDISRAITAVRTQRSSIVRAAFDAAALAGLAALLDRRHEDDSVKETLGNGAAVKEPYPPLLAAIESISSARDVIIDGVLEMDTAGSKRRRSLSPIPASSVSAAAATAAASTVAAADSPASSDIKVAHKRRKVDDKKKVNVGGESIADIVATSDIAAASSSDTDVKTGKTTSKATKAPTTFSSTATTPMVKRAGYFGKGRPGRPKGAGSSPLPLEAGSATVVDLGGGSSLSSSLAASSSLLNEEDGVVTAAAAVDTSSHPDSSRITKARAILCAAANLAFKELTPDFVSVSDGQEKAEGNDQLLRGEGEIDDLDIPQNTHAKSSPSPTAALSSDATSAVVTSSRTSETDGVNMGAVLIQAKTYADRAVWQANSAARRADTRAGWRASCAAKASALEQQYLDRHLLSDAAKDSGDDNDAYKSLVAPTQPPLFNIGNPFALGPVAKGCALDGPNWVSDDDEDRAVLSKPSFDSAVLSQSNTEQWSNVCLPRLLSIMGTGAGHAIIHDMDWATRAGRISELLRSANEDCGTRAGPHLIITTESDLDKFRVVFKQMNLGLSRYSTDTKAKTSPPTSLVYEGSPQHRRLLRLRHFATLPKVAFTSDSASCGARTAPPPFDVVLMTYSSFLADYPHFTRIPFHAVVLDDGISWLSLSASDGHGGLSKAYEGGMWSRADHHAGGAGVGVGAGGIGDSADLSVWDFGSDDGGQVVEKKVKKDGKDYAEKSAAPTLLLGLTARHRILLSPTLSVLRGDTRFTVPVTALLALLLPQFSDVVREEWDRAGMQQCADSMGHIKRLLCRSLAVHRDGGSTQNMMKLAMDSLSGKLSLPDNVSAEEHNSEDPVISTDAFIATSMISQSRRTASMWLRKGSPIRSELGNASLDPILNSVSARTAAACVCEEIATASSLTISGSSGAVTGSSSYRLAVRCGRTFGSESGLRQHIASSHAPPGTWVCRACGQDCCTSHARTVHERTCGTAQNGPAGDKKTTSKSKSTDAKNLGGMAPKVGQSGKKSKGGGGGKKSSAPPRDTDGSFCVPSWRGVWVNPAGRHFVKIDGKRLTEMNFSTDKEGKNDAEAGDAPTEEQDGVNSTEVKLFDSAEDAAKGFDDVAKKREVGQLELNFNPDGMRIVYQDSFGAPGELEVLGTDTSSVVPALAVINIRDLPPNVKPLLRDPRQTSRTGGQHKRHVYAYRGVCRQSRKGHDRWQSQISFAGTNHYLGTFDSEWDAAAIYSWAHLILYGEEATKQAQKEGEEAAAAYEQEKKDIASGKIPPPTAKAQKKEKKKPGPKRKKKTTSEKDGDGTAPSKKVNPKKKVAKSKTPKAKPSTKATGKKRPADVKVYTAVGLTPPKAPKALPAPPSPHLGKPVIDLGPNNEVALVARNLSRRQEVKEKDDESLINEVSTRILALRDKRCNETVASSTTRKARGWSACVPVTDITSIPSGGSILVGLNASDFSWDVDSFLSSVKDDLGNSLPREAANVLNMEYAKGGVNHTFCTVLQTAVCHIGRAGPYLEAASVTLGLGPVEIGASVGELECNIGGMPHSCSESAARIAFHPTAMSEYQLQATGGIDDIVTLNGRRILADAGPYPLRDQDVCSVGTRVFLFLLAPRS